MREGKSKWPPPGSWQALDVGCTCDPIPNHNGRYAPIEPSTWFIVDKCPVHDVD
jgi:hypothetical protein